MASIQASLGSRFLRPISLSYYYDSHCGRYMRTILHRSARLLMIQVYDDCK